MERRRRAFGRLCFDALSTVVGLGSSSGGGGGGSEEEAGGGGAAGGSGGAAEGSGGGAGGALAAAAVEEPLAAATRAELKAFAGKVLLFASGRSLGLVLAAESAAAPRAPLLPAALTVDALHLAQVLRALLGDRRGRRGAPAPALLPFILGLEEPGSARSGAQAEAAAAAEPRLSAPLLQRFAFRVAIAGIGSSSAAVRSACALLARCLGEKAFQVLCR